MGELIRELWVGSDRVRVFPAELEIETPVPNPDWEVSPHRMTLVRVEAYYYALVGVTPLGGSRHLYRLQVLDGEPSPERVGKRFTYDVDFTTQRDLDHRMRQASPLFLAALWLLRPLIGLLPSRTKLKILTKTGVHPIPATIASLAPAYLLFIATGLVVIIDVWTGVIPNEITHTLVGFSAVLLPDAIVRIGRLVHGGSRQYGFYEWLVVRLRDDD